MICTDILDNSQATRTQPPTLAPGPLLLLYDNASVYPGFRWLMWWLGYNEQTRVGWRCGEQWYMPAACFPTLYFAGGCWCWRYHQDCGGPHKDPLDIHLSWWNLVFATYLPQLVKPAVYNVHNSSQTVGGGHKKCISDIFSTSFNVMCSSILCPIQYRPVTALCPK